MALGSKPKLRAQPDAGPPRAAPPPRAPETRLPSRWEVLRPARGLLLGLLLAVVAWLSIGVVWLLLR